MDPADYLDGSTVTVAEPTYAVCQTPDPPADAFATVDERPEATAVVPDTHPLTERATAVEPGWRRLTFELDLPFGLVGFLAAVATALAEADVAVFVLSGYTTDHVLVKDADLPAAERTLRALGCTVEQQADRPEPARSEG